jgi:hypothetical protein
LYTDPTPCPAPLLEHSHPTTVTKRRCHIISSPSQSPFPTTRPQETPHFWDPAITPSPFKATPYFYQHLIRETPPTLQQCEQFRKEIIGDSLLSCSDGAYCPITKQGSHSWVFGSETQKHIASGTGPDDGHPASVSSHRPELRGILAALYIIHRICSYYDITSGKVILYCDNKSAIGTSFKPIALGISPFLSPNYDLIHLAKHIIIITRITIIGQWVKGHYSGNQRKIQHDLNDKADKLAGEHLETQDASKTKTIPIPCPGYQVRLVKHQCVIISKYYSVIAQEHHNQQLCEYILKKTKWSSTEFNLVNWIAHESAFKRLTLHQQISTAKLIHKLVNTNRQNFLYYNKSPLCPGCNMVEETLEHVLGCSAPQTEEFRTIQLEDLKLGLNNIQTPPKQSTP